MTAPFILFILVFLGSLLLSHLSTLGGNRLFTGFALLLGFFRGALVSGVIGGEGPLSEFDANLIGTGLNNEGIVLNAHDLAGDATDGSDAITDFQGVTHGLSFFFTLVFRTDQHKVEDQQHGDEHNNEGEQAAASESYGYTEEPLVSSDIVGMRFGSLFDATQTMVTKIDDDTYQVQVVAWYDNENSYTSQMVRTIKYFAEL